MTMIAYIALSISIVALIISIIGFTKVMKRQ